MPERNMRHARAQHETCLKNEFALKKDKLHGVFTDVIHGASGMQECIQQGQQTFICRDQGELIAEQEVSRWMSRDTEATLTENDLKELVAEPSRRRFA